MKKQFILLALFSFFILISKAQNVGEESPYMTKSYCILLSTKSYAEAKRIAEEASKKTNIKKDFRGLKPNKQTGLTMSRAACDSNGWEYPAYVARGRYDDGEFLSIEHSDAFKGFAKGYFIVVASCGNATENNATLKKVKRFYKTAYIKKSEVYMGCMH
jgi:hypothetical protein